MPYTWEFYGVLGGSPAGEVPHQLSVEDVTTEVDVLSLGEPCVGAHHLGVDVSRGVKHTPHQVALLYIRCQVQREFRIIGI